MPKPTFRNVDGSLIVLARTIGMIRTRIASMGTMAEYGVNEDIFWDLMIQSQYDLVVIEAFKLIDEKNLSLFSLIKLLKTEGQYDHTELDEDYGELKDFVVTPGFKLIQHRHSQKAHISRKTNSNLPRFADLSMIEDLLKRSASLITKYALWTKGVGYSIGFDSIYAGGNDELINTIRHIANRR